MIGRFASMGIDAYNFLAALNCVLAQRLVRMLCQSCRVPVPLDKTLAEESGLDYEEYKDAHFIRAKAVKNAMVRDTAAGNALRNS